MSVPELLSADILSQVSDQSGFLGFYYKNNFEVKLFKFKRTIRWKQLFMDQVFSHKLFEKMHFCSCSIVFITHIKVSSVYICMTWVCAASSLML